MICLVISSSPIEGMQPRCLKKLLPISVCTDFLKPISLLMNMTTSPINCLLLIMTLFMKKWLPTTVFCVHFLRLSKLVSVKVASVPVSARVYCLSPWTIWLAVITLRKSSHSNPVFWICLDLHILKRKNICVMYFANTPVAKNSLKKSGNLLWVTTTVIVSVPVVSAFLIPPFWPISLKIMRRLLVFRPNWSMRTCVRTSIGFAA